MSPFLKSPMRILVPLPRIDLFLGYAYLGSGLRTIFNTSEWDCTGLARSRESRDAQCMTLHAAIRSPPRARPPVSTVDAVRNTLPWHVVP
jgi:hypothetical protein